MHAPLLTNSEEHLSRSSSHPPSPWYAIAKLLQQRAQKHLQLQRIVQMPVNGADVPKHSSPERATTSAAVAILSFYSCSSAIYIFF